MIRTLIGFLMVWASVAALHYFYTHSTKRERKPVWKSIRVGLLTGVISTLMISVFVILF